MGEAIKKANEQKLWPKRSHSTLRLPGRMCQKVALKFASHGDYAASKLRPKSARREEIDVIKKHVGTAAGDEELAAYMLGSKATVRCLVETLIEAGFLSFAEDAFG